MHTHFVQQGESLATIADRYAFDRSTILDYPDNAELKKKRVDPNVLFPGDKVVIPDRELKRVEVATGKRHSFKVRLRKLELRVVLLDATGDPIAGEAYVLEAGGERVQGATTGKGEVKELVKSDAREATLTIQGRTLLLACSCIDPLADAPDEGASGARERLRNLGYAVGETSDLAHGSLRTALALFQHDTKLEVTGKLDDATRSKLANSHGS